MGKGFKYTFLQRRYTKMASKQAPEKMVNITAHWRNANQEHNEMPLLTLLGWL